MPSFWKDDIERNMREWFVRKLTLLIVVILTFKQDHTMIGSHLLKWSKRILKWSKRTEEFRTLFQGNKFVLLVLSLVVVKGLHSAERKISAFFLHSHTIIEIRIFAKDLAWDILPYVFQSQILLDEINTLSTNSSSKSEKDLRDYMWRIQNQKKFIIQSLEEQHIEPEFIERIMCYLSNDL